MPDGLIPPSERSALNAAVAERRAGDAQQTVRTVVMHQMGQLAAIRRSGFGLAAGTAALAVTAREQLLETQIEAASRTLADRARLADLLDELHIGAVWLRSDCETAIEAWSERSGLGRARAKSPVRLAAELLGLRQRPAIPLSALEQHIGSVDFADLLLARALEADLVTEAVVGHGDARRHGFARRSIG